MWRLRLEAPGALSMNLGFSEFDLPRGARLSIYPVDYQGLEDIRGVRVFSELDNRPDGTLWTPLVQADAIVLELLMPRSERADYRLTLDSINKGYRTFGAGKLNLALEKQGTCNIDVVCPEGDPWWDEINSVGVYTVNGVWFCSGAMINDTAQSGLPYFLTADHCGLSVSNDQGIVVYRGKEVKDIKRGDHVLFSGYAGTKLSIHGEGVFIIMPEDAVAAVVTESEDWAFTGRMLNDVMDELTNDIPESDYEGRVLREEAKKVIATRLRDYFFAEGLMF